MGSKRVVESDVVIVGASTAGLAVAMFLAEKGVNYVCVEQNDDIEVKTHCGYSWDTFTTKYDFSKEIWIQHYSSLHIHFPNGTLKAEIPSYLKETVGYLNRKQLYLEMYEKANISNNFIFGEKINSVLRTEDGEVTKLETDSCIYKGEIYVDCTGARGLLVKDYIGDSTTISATGLEHIYKRNSKPKEDVLEIFLGDVCEGGYGWVAPIKDRINVGVGKFLGLGGTSLPRALDKLLSMEFFNNKSIGLLEEEEASLLPVNLLKRFTYKNTIGIGDSVGQVNPLVGEGVRFILSSAELATVAIEKALQRSSHKYLLEYTSMWYKKYGKYYNRAELLQKVAKRSKFRSYWKFQLIYRVLKYNSPENLVKFFKGHTTSRLILKIFIRTISSIVIPRSFLKSSVEVSIKKA